MLAGTLFALLAGLFWGLVFIAPVLLPDYPAALLSFSRYLAFGLIALPLAWLDRHRLAEFTAGDWWYALRLSLVGNVLYYMLVVAAIQRAGAPLPSIIIGTLPVVIAICSNLRNTQRDGRVSWAHLAPSLALIATGVGLVNHAELQHLRSAGSIDLDRYAWGALFAIGAVVCWTWYPIRNADWLHAHPERSARAWATAQGLATLPLAAMGVIGLWIWSAGTNSTFAMPLGPTPGLFLGVMLVVGLLSSWLGTLCWNEASKRLPTRLAGQLIVFETLAALAYAFVLRREFPPAVLLAGVAVMVAGVFLAVRVQPAAKPVMP